MYIKQIMRQVTKLKFSCQITASYVQVIKNSNIKHYVMFTLYDLDASIYMSVLTAVMSFV